MKPTKLVDTATTTQYHFNQDILQWESDSYSQGYYNAAILMHTYKLTYVYMYAQNSLNDIPEAPGGESNQKRLCIITSALTWLNLFIQ